VGQAATKAVVDAAADWLKARGLESIRGPFNPTINDDCAIWIDGESYPTFLMPSNPRYYDQQLQAAGLEPVKPLRVYRLGLDQVPEEKWARWAKFAARIQRTNPEITLRGANFKELDSEVRSFVSVFNAAWSQNWGFAPMSYAELRSLAELFQYVVDPNLIRAAEVEEGGVRKMVGVIIAVPDLNEFLRSSNGSLLHPATIWKLARMKLMGKPTNRIRVAVLGVLPEYRHTPVSALLLYDGLRVAKEFGAREVEASWVLEDNIPMIKPLEDYHFTVTDRYMLYEKAT
jgi:GNAT superfamily N-acetyltransferase